MPAVIERNPEDVASRHHKLVVVGGGIYGICLALEAAQRGIKVLMLERGDFGGEVSWNSLRILHGGLRYLQKMDLRRFYESVGERRWFLEHFPDLCGPLPCMMPLYGSGMRRASIFRVALKMNDILSLRKNHKVDPANHLGSGKVISAEDTAALFPQVDRDGLEGSAIWADGQMRNSQRLFMELCRWAASGGAELLNYVEATGLEIRDGAVCAVEAKDRKSGESLKFSCDCVVNAAGPWCADVSELMGEGRRDLFPPAIAFNVLFDRPPMAKTAVAVTAKEPGARTYFLHNEGGYLLGGTYHAPAEPSGKARLGELVKDYMDQVNRAVPGLELRSDQVLRVYHGMLRARKEGDEDPVDHPTILDHGKSGGTKGLWTISGVKYTTARLVAEQTLAAIFPGKIGSLQRPASGKGAILALSDHVEALPLEEIVGAAKRILEEEAVTSFADLMLRRTAWALDPDVGSRLARKIGPLIGYQDEEIERCCEEIGQRFFQDEPKTSKLSEVA